MISGKIVYPNGLGREHPFINEKNTSACSDGSYGDNCTNKCSENCFQMTMCNKISERVENAKMDGTVISAMKVSSSLKKSIYKIVCD